MPSGIDLTKEQIDYVRENFANTPNKELAKQIGISPSSVTTIQRRYHLKKSPAHSKKMHHLSGCATSHTWANVKLTPELLEKRAASFKKTWRIENARIRFGLEQKTKIHIARCCIQKVKQNYYLRSRGYIIDEKNLIAYYTPETKRATRMEAIPRGQKKGTIKPFYSFRSIDDRDNKDQ